MATTTPNFGWAVPTSTDLVKDGAVAIETLGDSIDASLVDLKGGTTGQVLAKASNTDMDFSWVAQDDSNAIQNAIVDAKGDLIAATANDTPARLAVGTNGFLLQADSTAATGLAYTGRRWYTLASGSLSGTEVNLSSLSTAYQTLRLEIYSPQTASAGVPVSIRFNSNSSNVYEGCAITSLGTGVINYASGSAILPMFNQENCPTSAGTYSMFIETDVYNDTVRKFIRGMWNQTDNVVTGGHCFNSTTAITSIQIRLDGTATFNGGTYVLRGI
jgi:hypothetical protein